MRSLTIALLVVVSCTGTIPAEQPDWDATAQRLLVIRRHWEADFGQQFSGLWSFDPDTETWDRLRAFVFNAPPYLYPAGQGSALAAAEGTILFQGWPYWLELEPGSWRILRRASPLQDPTGLGWGVQGPVVTPALSQRLGLEPGTYGFASCMLSLLTAGHPWGVPVPCDPYSLPSGGGPIAITGSAPWPLLHRDSAGVLDLVTHLPPLDWDPTQGQGGVERLILSVDPDHARFWRGAPQGVELLPLEAGSVGQPSDSLTFDFPPFDDPQVGLESLYFHPLRREFFLTTPVTFQSLDGELRLIGSWPPPGAHLGNPLAMASLPERPALHEQLIPVVAHAAGRKSTFWTAELWLYNPSGEATSVELARVMAAAQRRTLQLPAHGSLRVPDLLAFLGGGPQGDGSTHDAVLVTSPWRFGEQVVAAARVSTPAAGGGAYGHAAPAVPGRTGYSNHLVPLGQPEPEWLGGVFLRAPALTASELDLDRREPGRFRHNLGVVNTGDDQVTLTLLWGHVEFGHLTRPQLLAHRPPEALQELVVAPHTLLIVDVESLFPAEVRDGWPARIGVWGDRPAALWLSMVDNLTGDATFVPYTSFGGEDVEREAMRCVAPVVVHGSGDAGTRWRTDLYTALDDDTFSLQPAYFHPADRAGTCSGAAGADGLRELLYGEVSIGKLPPWWDHPGHYRTVVPDLARAFPDCAADEEVRGGMELVAGTWFSAWTRTYTTRDDGGTYGDMLPLYPLGGWPVQHFAGVEVGEQYRVNVGLFNGDHEHAITHRLTLHAADGREVAQRTLTLEPLASFSRRLEHLFLRQVGELPAGTYGLTVLPLDDPAAGVNGRSWAYVSLVDNVTGDPTNWW